MTTTDASQNCSSFNTAAESASSSPPSSTVSGDDVRIDMPVQEKATPPAKNASPQEGQMVIASGDDNVLATRKSSRNSHQSHAHTSKPPLITSILSGMVCGLMFYVFSAVFAAMIFDEAGADIPEYQSVGLAMNTLSAFTGGLLFASLSSCRAVMAGPDITPAVFMVEIAKQISSSLCPDGTTDCDPESREKILPTLLIAMWLSTAMVGATFYALGRFRLTSIVGFMPANVTGGFLSCIGYKVIYYATEVACGSKIKWFEGDGKYIERVLGSWEPTYYHESTQSWRGGWKLILPALVIGLVLYYLKRKHIGKPVYNFPGMIIIPTAIFYIVLFATGGSLDSARTNGWMFTKSDNTLFWKQWEYGYSALGSDKVAWDQLPACIAILAVYIPIVSLDNMLKLASSEVALQMDLDYNNEIKIGGMATLLNSFLISTPCYGQTKFNVLNYGFTHSTESRVAGIVMALFCGTFFLAGFPLLNYLPRLLLSGLLIFSAAGFLWENLVEARHKFNRYSFVSIWIVWIANFLASELLPLYSLLVAILVGVILSAFGFAYTFARNSQLSPPLSGEEFTSTAVRSAGQEMKLGVLGRWYYIFTARGFLFFGTASRLYRLFKAHVAENQSLPRCERTKVIIFDMTQVYGVDATTEAVFQKIKRLASKQNIELVWAGLSTKMHGKFDLRGVIDGTHCFKTLDQAAKYVEDELLTHVHDLAQRWLVDKTCRHTYNRAMLHDSLTAHAISDGSIGPSQLFKWSIKVAASKGDVVFEEGDADSALYLLYMGKLELTSISPPSSVTVYPGAFFNENVLYNGARSGTLYTATAAEDCIMLRVDAGMRQEMLWHEPHTAYTMVLSVFRQAELREPHRRHPSHAKPEILQGVLSGTPAVPLSPTLLEIVEDKAPSDSASKDGTTKDTESGKPGSTRHIVAARKSRMHGTADKMNSTYKNLLSQVHDLHVPHVHVPHVHVPHVHLRSAQKKSTDMGVKPERSGGWRHAGHDVEMGRASRGSDGGEDFPVLHRHHDGRAREDMRHETILDQEFLVGNDYVVPFTAAQEEHYALIFKLNDHDDKGQLRLSELSRYMHSLGYGVPETELQEMLHEVGINEASTGAINESDFVEFMRRSLVASLPKSKIPKIDRLFNQYVSQEAELSSAMSEPSYDRSAPAVRTAKSADAAVADKGSQRLRAGGLDEESSCRINLLRQTYTNERQSDTIQRKSAFAMLHDLGFELDEHTFAELFEEVDSRNEGTITRDEFITALGMLKQNILEVMNLEKAFTRLRSGRTRVDVSASSSRRRGSNMIDRVRPSRFSKADSAAEIKDGSGRPAKLHEHMVYASDLVATLGVSEIEAEEMIFIADLQDNQAIDFTEFKQVVANWS